MPLRHFTDPQILESDKTLVLYFLFYFDFTQSLLQQQQKEKISLRSHDVIETMEKKVF